jgi:hypothetical protein
MQPGDGAPTGESPAAPGGLASTVVAASTFSAAGASGERASGEGAAATAVGASCRVALTGGEGAASSLGRCGLSLQAVHANVTASTIAARTSG